MFLFIIFLLLLLVSIGGGATGIFTKSDTRIIALAVAGVAFILAIPVFLLDTLTTVGTKNVGVITTFGRPSGYLDNGLHFVMPWQDVTELDNAIQTDTYASDRQKDGSLNKQGGATETCINVRIARQGTACVNVSIRWQARQSKIDYLFRNYHDNHAITDNLVLRDLQQTMNQYFVSYDPFGFDAHGLNTNQPLAAPVGTSYSSEVLNQMRKEIGQWIDVMNVNIPILNFDSATQDKISQLQQQVAATQVALQAQQTAKAQAVANQELAASVAKDPNVLTDKCLNILKEAVDKSQALPAGFSCFQGGANTAVAIK